MDSVVIQGMVKTQTTLETAVRVTDNAVSPLAKWVMTFDVAPPGQAEVGYNVLARPAHAPYADPDTWLAEAPRREGSWWGELVGWLAARSGRPVAPPRLASPGLGDAPGTHVLQE